MSRVMHNGIQIPQPDLLDPPPVVETATAVRTILHLCADTGSDSWPYRLDPRYEVITVGSDIGVENYHPDRPIHGIIANPVCTEFSRVRRRPAWATSDWRESDPEQGMQLVRECLRVIEEAQPAWWAIENPATGTLRNYLGKPRFTYQPWWYGSPWTKLTGLWGSFTPPPRHFYRWEDVTPISDLWVRSGRSKPSIVYAHKSAFHLIPEFRDSGMPEPQTDAEFRSLCSQRFAHAFKEANP